MRFYLRTTHANDFSDKGNLGMPPTRGFAILTCMDARIDPAKLAGLAHVIRNAGLMARKRHPLQDLAEVATEPPSGLPVRRRHSRDALMPGEWPAQMFRELLPLTTFPRTHESPSEAIENGDGVCRL
jgi:hypothetical protein